MVHVALGFEVSIRDDLFLCDRYGVLPLFLIHYGVIISLFMSIFVRRKKNLFLTEAVSSLM